MSVNAKTENFEHIELFGRPALFTNGRINRQTVPLGFYVYDFRGSDNDPGLLKTVEPSVMANHSGSVITKEPIDMKGKSYRRVLGKINFLGEQMTIEQFCEIHEIVQEQETEVEMK